MKGLNEMNGYTVYAHINKENGRRYIGATSLSLSKRSESGMGYAKQPRFFKDIIRFGWDGFNHEVLFTGLTLDEAQEVEAYLINKFDTTNPEKGYNVQHGGGIPTIEAREKMSKAKKENPPRKSYPKRPVLCYEDMEVFDSVCDCARSYGIHPSVVSAGARQERRTRSGKEFIFTDKMPDQLVSILRDEVDILSILSPAEINSFGD